jgi:UDP-N-acetylglucosamine 2-epimerase
LRAQNLLEVSYDAAALEKAILRCVEDEGFREQCRTCENPYGAGQAGQKIAESLATIPIDKQLLQKKMLV